MRELCVNQGAGLQRIGMQAAPRVIAIASHGSQDGELPLLWSLCATLMNLGHSVAVLDATTVESATNPGLEQLLNEDGWHNESNGTPQAWSVVPAAQGLRQLCAMTAADQTRLNPLSALFQNFDVVAIYARAEVLTGLLAGTGVEPLLTVSPGKLSAVTAYQALKHMLLNAKLRPTIASVGCESLSASAAAKRSVVKNLQDCAMTFLDYRIDSLAVPELKLQDGPTDGMNRLALRLLENAVPLHRNRYLGNH